MQPSQISYLVSVLGKEDDDKKGWYIFKRKLLQRVKTSDETCTALLLILLTRIYFGITAFKSKIVDNIDSFCLILSICYLVYMQITFFNLYVKSSSFEQRYSLS